MFFQAPTSATITFSAANAFSIARIRPVSFSSTLGQYAALYPRRRCSRANSAGSSERRKMGPPRRIREPAAGSGRAAASAMRDRRVMAHLLLVDGPRLHHELDVAKRGDVLGRVAF